MASNEFFDDVRQAGVVAKYEAMKFIKGMKFLIFAAIVGGLFVISTLLTIFFNDDPSTIGVAGMYIGFTGFLFYLGVTLFSSNTLVSEFEERTALILFTKPVRKISIFLGKWFTSFMLNVVVIFVYYIAIMIADFAITGGAPAEIWASFGYGLAYIFALNGIAIMFSSIFRKSSSAAIITFIFLLLGLQVIELAISMSMDIPAQDMWYMLDVASLVVPNALTGVTDGARAVLTMIVWGLLPSALAYFLFQRREV